MHRSTIAAALAALLFAPFSAARSESGDHPLKQAESVLDAIKSPPNESLKVSALPQVSRVVEPAVPRSTIAGKWTGRSGESVKTYEFAENGTFSLRIKNPYFGQSKNGTWSQQGDDVTAKFVDSGAPGTGGFSKGRAIKVKLISNDKLEVDGETVQRTR